MFVCACHAVSDRTLRGLAARGLSPAEVRSLTGAGSACGCCADAVAATLAAAVPCRETPCPDCPRAVPRAA